ncbi:MULTISPECIES: hypothetical protein [unclassified Sporosarcina]|uniref:hypothetical protein n=1 Tax=unclassified Sporosarcina TaxID=2647733 RepID=UPI001A92015C|nr:MULTISPECIES: hypothetical protein [unclassified Sporosarcina]MBO0588193.1 hypothetical protein [Sporosarcina sp. E16_8]MBO0601947.1 hypothetical protein [Sporosarcina sp. E16_3]
MKNHIIFFSGGKASFTVAHHVKERFPNDNILLYFTDTQWEDDDLYRFIYQAADRLELPMLTHATGLNPLELMFEKKLVFNSRIGDCSKLLKMKVAADFLKRGKKPLIEKWRNKERLKSDDFIQGATLYFGIGFDEMHREKAIRKNWRPFDVEMPLINEYVEHNEVLAKYNLRQPRLYDMHFTHNNCMGRCVKAGQAHFKNLKEQMPDEFKKLLKQEHHLKVCVDSYRYIKAIPDNEICESEREYLYQEIDDAYRDYFYGRMDKPKMYIPPAATASPENVKFTTYSFMKKSIKGIPKPYPLSRFDKELLEDEKQLDIFDFGGCGCFVEYEQDSIN